VLAMYEQPLQSLLSRLCRLERFDVGTRRTRQCFEFGPSSKAALWSGRYFLPEEGDKRVAGETLDILQERASTPTPAGAVPLPDSSAYVHLS
jgi:hypothetical protein